MIIVTGGAGFIGSNIIKKLNQIGYNDIIVVDNLTDGKKIINLVDLNVLDYLDKEEFITNVLKKNIIKDIEVIFHEGACSSTFEWDGKYIMSNNFTYSKILLHYCIEKKISFLYASSASIYNKNNKYFIENIKYEKPSTMYSYSKFLFDQYVRNIIPKVSSQICGLRYFNVYGPNENHKKNMASIIFQLNNQIINNQKLLLFTGSKNFKRDFIHVNDVVSVNLWCWKNKISGIFNCGTGQEESFRKIAELIITFYNKNKYLIHEIIFPEKLKPFYQTFTKANLTKLRSIGYKKKFLSIKKGVFNYIKWLNYKKKNKILFF